MRCPRSHRVQIRPSNRQQGMFQRWIGVHRWAYNWDLERKKAAYEAEGKSPSRYDLQKEIVTMKRTTHLWLAEIPRTVPRCAMLSLERAYANFFRRVKNGEVEKGFPTFKSRRTARKVFHLEAGDVGISEDRKSIRVPKAGWVRSTNRLRFEGKLLGTVAVSEEAGRWYASPAFEVEIPDPPDRSGDPVVGIDVGIHTLMTLSDGKRYENPKATYKLERLLARVQRQLSRRQKGSNRWKRAKRRVQRIQKRIKDARVNAAHQATAEIAGDYGLVAMEDLNVKGMVQNRTLAKAISDSNWNRLRQQLTYKTVWSGSELRLVDPRYTTQTCNVCGCINGDLTLSDRRWVCDCGAVHDRDLNAAQNILAAALKLADESAVTGRGGKGGSTLPIKRQAGSTRWWVHKTRNPELKGSLCAWASSVVKGAAHTRAGDSDHDRPRGGRGCAPHTRAHPRGWVSPRIGSSDSQGKPGYTLATAS